MGQSYIFMFELLHFYSPYHKLSLCRLVSSKKSPTWNEPTWWIWRILNVSILVYVVSINAQQRGYLISLHMMRWRRWDATHVGVLQTKCIDVIHAWQGDEHLTGTFSFIYYSQYYVSTITEYGYSTTKITCQPLCNVRFAILM